MARKIKNKKQTKDNTLNQEIFGVITCFCSFFLIYGVFSRGNLGDWGNAIINFFFGLLGNVAYIFPFFLLIFGIQFITKSTKKRKRFFRFSVLFMLCISFLLFLINEKTLYSESDGFMSLLGHLFRQGQLDNPIGGGAISVLVAPFIKFFGLVCKF